MSRRDLTSRLPVLACILVLAILPSITLLVSVGAAATATPAKIDTVKQIVRTRWFEVGWQLHYDAHTGAAQGPVATAIADEITSLI